MSKQPVDHHRKAAEHHEQAAQDYKEEATYHEAGKHEKAAHDAHLAHPHHLYIAIMLLKPPIAPRTSWQEVTHGHGELMSCGSHDFKEGRSG